MSVFWPCYQTNTILSLMLTKRVKRRLLLRNVLQLDFFFFYLLPDLTVSSHSWCQSLLQWPNRTSWYQLVSVMTALNSIMLILIHFYFFPTFLAVYFQDLCCNRSAVSVFTHTAVATRVPSLWYSLLHLIMTSSVSDGMLERSRAALWQHVTHIQSFGCRRPLVANQTQTKKGYQIAHCMFEILFCHKLYFALTVCSMSC